MKSFLLTLACILAVSASAFATQCNVSPVKITKDWITMTPGCRQAVRQQIQTEVGAALQYLAMGAHFARDRINRPGFAKLFFDASSEEREHAMKLIEYLLMRGELTTDVSSLITVRPPPRTSWESGQEALEHALTMEAEVTRSIKQVIVNCEHDRQATAGNANDYHLVDYLTGDFLDEQYKGQRDLAGKASTLKKMMDRHESLGEFIFDKKLLGMDV